MEIKTCHNCDGKCCKYVAMEIDKPKTKSDFENLKWFVCHKNVHVYVEEDGTWNVEFITPCEFLGESNKCKIYKDRPEICREYDHDECTFHNDYKEKHTFTNLIELQKFIDEKFKKK